MCTAQKERQRETFEKGKWGDRETAAVVKETDDISLDQGRGNEGQQQGWKEVDFVTDQRWGMSKKGEPRAWNH